MRKEEEIIELGMNNICIDDRTRWTVPRTISIPTISWEETDVMTFRDDDESDFGSVSLLQGFACGTDSFDFGFDDVGELTFGDTVTEE